MKGLFCFDGPMYCDINGVYCNTTLTNQVFNRYLNVVDHLTIAIRTFHLNDDFKEANLHRLELDKLRMVELPNMNSLKGLILDRESVYKTLYKLVEEADLIFARMPSIISNIAINIAIKLKKPYLVEVGGCVWDSYWNHGFQGKLAAPFLFLQTRNLIKQSPYAVYVTEDFLQRRYPSQGKRESCSNVALPEFSDSILEKRLIKIKEINRNIPIIIGTTAAIDVRYKGQEYVIEAIARLNRQGFNFEYELVGAGEKDYLESVAEKWGVLDKVKFKGKMLRADVLKWLDRIDIYAQPSKQEGLPRALIEAMSRGCPSIGSTTAGIPELLSKNVLFKNGDIEGICTILIRMSNEFMTEMATRNFEKSKDFDSKIIEKRRNDIFKDFSNFVGNKRS